MLWSNQPGIHEFVVFTLVLARVATMVVVAPVFGSKAVPLRARALLALALAALVVPLEAAKSTSPPATMPAYLVLMGAECLIGLTLGLGIMVLFSGVKVAGQIISQMCGLQLADVYDPHAGASTPGFGQLFFYVALAVFVTIGGHRTLIEALLDTFARLPSGQGQFSRSAVEAMTSLLTQSFVLGMRAAAPTMLALLLATLILGLVSRALPQLNVLVLGFGFNMLVTLAVVALSLGASAWLFPDQLHVALETIQDTLAWTPDP